MRPSKQIIQETHQLIQKYITRTELLQSERLTQMIGCKQLLFKAENTQKAGAFKARGACNAILRSSSNEVCTNSSGNHGAALALMAQLTNKKAHIVMPSNSPKIKIDNVQQFGGRIIFSGQSVKDREEMTVKVQQETGAQVIHPYNNWDVIAGQSTVAKEIYEQVEDVDYLLVPIGGGGLCSGSLLSTKYFSPKTKVIGVEPLIASDAKQSLQIGQLQPQMDPITIADDKTFPIIQELIEDILTVDEESLIKASFLAWKTLKVMTETSSGTVLAALLQNKQLFEGKRVVAILSGGNVDLNALKPHIDLYDQI